MNITLFSHKSLVFSSFNILNVLSRCIQRGILALVNSIFWLFFFFFNLIFSIKLGKIKGVKNPLNNLTFIHYSVDAILGRHA